MASRLIEAPASIPEDPSPIFFWHEDEEPFGYISQWYKAPLHDTSVPEIVFPTAEHWMMYQKAKLFHDDATAAQIISPEGQKMHPRKIKSWGQEVQGFDEKIRNRERVRIVEEGNWWKFTASIDRDDGENRQTPPLRNWLLATGERELVEASPFDTIWGIGFHAKDALSKRKDWGLNLLGKALMLTRERLRQEEKGLEREMRVNADSASFLHRKPPHQG